MFNNVALIGYLGSCAESYTKRAWKNRPTSERQSQTTWYRCLVFGRTAEYATTLTKAAHLQIICKIRTRERLAKGGAKKSVTPIRVQRFTRFDWTPTRKRSLLRIRRTS